MKFMIALNEKFNSGYLDRYEVFLKKVDEDDILYIKASGSSREIPIDTFLNDNKNFEAMKNLLNKILKTDKVKNKESIKRVLMKVFQKDQEPYDFSMVKDDNGETVEVKANDKAEIRSAIKDAKFNLLFK